MARTNKYSSLNFNDIYEKKVVNSHNNNSNNSSSSSPSFPPSSSPSSNKTAISNSRIHGHMLVLSKPTTPKPIIIPQNPSEKIPSLTKPGKVSDQTGSEQDTISLRPQGRTGSGSPVVLSPLASPGKPSSPLTSPLLKSDRFVPPHLRPGFVGREDKLPGQEFVKVGGGIGGGRGRGQFGAQNIYGEDGRPKSGGGNERMRRIDGEPEAMEFRTRPGSSGARPSSSG